MSEDVNDSKPKTISEMMGKPIVKVPKAEVKEPVKVLTLSPEMGAKVLDALNDNKDNPPSIDELIEIAWGSKFDVRSPEGMAVRSFISDKKQKMDKFEDEIVLTPEQKAYIDTNAFNMSSLEISKILFRNENLTPLNKESRAVYKYFSEVNTGKKKYDKTDDYTEDDYTPPNSIIMTVSRVKRYVPMSQLDSRKLTQREKKAAESLMAYLHTLRFKRQITSFSSAEDRELFESEFIRCCYDKSDLTEEEVDQYIVYSNEVVISRNIQKSINIFQKKLEDDSDEDKKISMVLVEAIGKMRDEYNASIKRQQDLLKDLKGKRADRVKERLNDNASVLNLVQAWKEEEFRRKTIHLAIKRQETLKEDIKELTDMDEIKARIFGISQDEILHG